MQMSSVIEMYEEDDGSFPFIKLKSNLLLNIVWVDVLFIISESLRNKHK